MKRKKNNGSVFLRNASILLLTCLPCILLIPKGILELNFNRWHSAFLDFVFVNLTYLGDGIIFLPLILFVSFRKASYSLFLLFTAILNSILVFIGKKILFPGMPRPATFFEGVNFYMIPGLDIHHWNSFPSGHTTSAFAIGLALSMIFSKNRTIQTSLFFLATLIGISRVYLMQHFFIDIWAGAITGMLSTLLAREITIRFFSSKKLKKPIFRYGHPTYPQLKQQLIFRQRWAELLKFRYFQKDPSL